MAEKSLIIITPGFPSDENDSTCLPTQQLFVLTAKHLFPELQLIVISLQYPANQNSYQWHGIEVHPLNGKKYKGLLRLVFWSRAQRILKRLTKDKNLIGVLSFWCNEAAFIGNRFARIKSIPHKIWISGQDARNTNRFVKWINPKPENLVAMSDFLSDEFFKNHRIKPGYVIPNGVRPSFQNQQKDIDIIGAGSLIILKQYDIFVDVIAEIRKTNPSLTVALFGTGPEENNLKTKIERLGLSETIKLYGEVDHDTLIQWMNRSKILLHPSSYEGYSTVCLEALACGCKVVSFTFAENTPIPHWEIVMDKSEMIIKVASILKNESPFTPVLVRDIDTTVRSMISLFTKQ